MSKLRLACASALLMFLSGHDYASATPAPGGLLDGTSVEIKKTPGRKDSSLFAPSDANFFSRLFELAQLPGIAPIGNDWFASDLVVPVVNQHPRMEVIQNSNDIVVKAEVPGFDEKQLSLTVSNDQLILKGGRKDEDNQKSKSSLSQHSFVRSMTLPCAIDMDKSEASLKNGILTVTLPKMQSAELHCKQIAIHSQ